MSGKAQDEQRRLTAAKVKKLERDLDEALDALNRARQLTTRLREMAEVNSGDRGDG